MIKDLLLYFALLLWFVVPSQAQPTIFAEDVEAHPGDEVEVLFKVENFVDVVAWQFTFEWDAQVLEFIDFPQFNLVDLRRENFGPSLDSLEIDNYVTSVWFENMLVPVNFPNDETIFSMRFKVIGEPADSSKLWFSGSQVENVVSADGVPSEFASRMGMFRVTGDPNNVITIPENFNLSISPNPFQTETQVRFNLEENHKNYNISIYALDGRQVYSQTQYLPAGEHVFEVDESMLPVTGMYLLHMTSDNLHTTHKLIFENY